MKRLLKFFLNLALALVAVSLTFLVIFFLTPAWQKRVVQEALARDSARSWQFESVDIKPHRVEVENLYLLDGDIGAGIHYAQFNGPLWKLALMGDFHVTSGSVIGLSLDVSKVKIGDLRSKTYQDFMERVSADPEFWKERVGLVLSKFSAYGVRVQLENVQINGHVIMPGQTVIPVRWVILQADSTAPRLIQLEPLAEKNIL